MAIEFWVNDQHILTDAPEGQLLLDFLRKDLHRTGTKEGCKEGDCGACTVMVGQLQNGAVDYHVMTSCLIPVGEMHGKHVVTVEGVATNHHKLNPVQQAMVDRGGSQCGYCTPGFIVSMTWWMLAEKNAPTVSGVKRAVSGNLCRCTGYNSIKRAGDDLVGLFEGQASDVWAAPDRIQALVERDMLPAYFLKIPEKLEAIQKLEIPAQNSPDFHIGGGTDLYVQKGEQIPSSNVALLARYPELRGIRVKDGFFVLGGMTTFEEFAHHPEIRKIIPDVDEWMWLIASLHLRNRATIAGNIINASPIGDMSNLMLALDAELVLKKGDLERAVALKEFYKGYKSYDKTPDEIVAEIRFPDPKNATIRFEKVSKRKALDIATVNSGAKIRVTEQNVVEEASISVGGVAAYPLWLKRTGNYLTGKTLDSNHAAAALEIAMDEIAPISDVRGSADYKRLLARQLVFSHLNSIAGGTLAKELL